MSKSSWIYLSLARSLLMVPRVVWRRKEEESRTIGEIKFHGNRFFAPFNSVDPDRRRKKKWKKKAEKKRKKFGIFFPSACTLLAPKDMLKLVCYGEIHHPQQRRERWEFTIWIIWIFSGNACGKCSTEGRDFDGIYGQSWSIAVNK